MLDAPNLATHFLECLCYVYPRTGFINKRIIQDGALKSSHVNARDNCEQGNAAHGVRMVEMGVDAVCNSNYKSIFFLWVSYNLKTAI